MDSFYEMKKVKFIVKSLIHIGSVEQKLTPFEYIHRGQYVYSISEEKLSRFLLKWNLIDPYVRAVDRDAHRFRIMDFFSQNGIHLKDEDFVTLSAGRRIKVLGDTSKLQDYRPFIRDGLGDVYIPGTSLKGVFRTAILYNILARLKSEDPKGFQERVEQRILADVNKKVNKKRLFEWGIERWFESFQLDRKEKCPNTDWLRMLYVTDAYAKEKLETILIPVNVLKKEAHGWVYKKEKSGKDTTIWVECLPEGATLEFQITWDRRLLEEFRKKNKNIQLPQSIDEVFSYTTKWSNDITKFERNFSTGHDLQKWYKNNLENFRIGFGSGMTSTTISILFEDELRKKIRNYAGLNRGNEIAPKSRRVWIKNNQPVPLGWVFLEFIE
ncbi:MAG: type III-A CRISPR-associated RAMP protein Csm5 [Thermodesulfobacteriota bacterium]